MECVGYGGVSPAHMQLCNLFRRLLDTEGRADAIGKNPRPALVEKKFYSERLPGCPRFSRRTVHCEPTLCSERKNRNRALRKGWGTLNRREGNSKSKLPLSSIAVVSRLTPSDVPGSIRFSASVAHRIRAFQTQ